MQYFSMFSGIGGFERGIEDAFTIQGVCDKGQGLPRTTTAVGSAEGQSNEHVGQADRQGLYGTCIGYSELDPNAINIYGKHFPNHKGYGDATKINEKELPDFDLLVGGFPCQAFSIAGQRRGFDDTRGTLFFDIARILREKRPGNFLLENVKGLLSHDNGNTFKTIITTLAEMGYIVEWEVLNSKNFGVPQNRERVFIHGFREGCGRQIFPLGSTDQEVDISLVQVGNVDTAGHNSLWGRVYDSEGIATNQNALGGGVGAKTGLYAIRVNEGVAEETKDEDLCITKSYHKGFDNHGQRTGIAIDVYNKRLRTECPTLTDPCHNSIRMIQDFKIRRLTPIETERLQGFPDDWTKFGADGKTMSDSARYKACGNAVTTNVITAVIEKMYENEILMGQI